MPTRHTLDAAAEIDALREELARLETLRRLLQKDLAVKDSYVAFLREELRVRESEIAALRQSIHELHVSIAATLDQPRYRVVDALNRTLRRVTFLHRFLKLRVIGRQPLASFRSSEDVRDPTA